MVRPASRQSIRRAATSSMMLASVTCGISHPGFHTRSRVSARTVPSSFWCSMTAISTRTTPSYSATGSSTRRRKCSPRTSVCRLQCSPVSLIQASFISSLRRCRGPLRSDKIAGATQVPQSFSHRMMAQTPIRTQSGTVRITDSKVFPVSTAIAAALVEVAPGAMRELHWHPNTDEWQYYIEGQARMGVFAASGQARTFDFQANDVGYVPFAMGHYIENTRNTKLRFLEIFKSDYYADVSLDQWLALTPPELVGAHLRSDPQLIRALRKDKVPVVPA